MIGVVPSRRDDFISLVYILLYMVTGNFKFLSINKNAKFDEISYMKHIATANTLCSKQKCIPFYEFVKEVLSIKFEDEPNYESLKHKLKKIVTDQGQQFDQIFDWNKK